MLALYLSHIGLMRLDRERAALALARQGAQSESRPLTHLAGRGGAWREGSRDIAAGAIRLRLLEAAVDRRLLVERIAIEPAVQDATAAIIARVTVSGPEAAVVRYVADIERGRPLVRFADWQLRRSAAGDGTVRFDGHAASIWAGR